MAGAPSFLSRDQFASLYGEEKPYFEYWFGEAVQKPMPTSLHGILQSILAMLLWGRGWRVATEIRLRLSAVAEPVPDVIADRRRIAYAMSLSHPNPVQVGVTESLTAAEAKLLLPLQEIFAEVDAVLAEAPAESE